MLVCNVHKFCHLPAWEAGAGRPLAGVDSSTCFSHGSSTSRLPVCPVYLPARKAAFTPWTDCTGVGVRARLRGEPSLSPQDHRLLSPGFRETCGNALPTGRLRFTLCPEDCGVMLGPQSPVTTGARTSRRFFPSSLLVKAAVDVEISACSMR